MGKRIKLMKKTINSHKKQPPNPYYSNILHKFSQDIRNFLRRLRKQLPTKGAGIRTVCLQKYS